MGIWFLEYLVTPFQRGYVRIGVFDLNMKAQGALFPNYLTTRLTRKPFNALMDITSMLPKLLLFLKTYSRNKALKHFHFVFAGGLITLM